MPYSADQQLKKVVFYLAAVIALVVALVIPSAFYYMQHSELSGSLQYKADLLADDISSFAYNNPENWYLQQNQLLGLLQRNAYLQVEQLQLRAHDLSLDLKTGKFDHSPFMQRSSRVYDGSYYVADVMISTSLYPQLVNTVWVFSASLGLASIIYIALYLWPFKMLKLAISRLEGVRHELEEEVAANKKLLSESNELAEKLLVEHDFNNTILEVASNVIVVIDVHGCFYRFNRAAEMLTGYKRREVIGRPVWDLVIPEEQQQAVRNVFENLLKGKVDIAGYYENDWLTRDGQRRTLDWYNSVLRDKQGHVTHTVSFGYDITDRKIEEEQRSRLQRELNQSRKMEALGQLTGGIAHDFNNILGIITGYSELAAEDLEKMQEPELEQYVQNILESARRASELVKQMMVFSRNDPSAIELLQMEQVVQESLNMLRPVLPSSIQLSFEYQADLPRASIDAIKLQQIIMNLCLNARDAMQGKGVIKVSLRLCENADFECSACHQQVHGQWLQLCVQDSGSGMSREVLERIFEPFFTTKDIGKGTGMGLSVVHSIMDAHQGHIRIETEPGIGTCFNLLFPAHLEAASQQLKADSQTPLSMQGALDNKKVLVVDDELAIAEFIEKLLSKAGYVCEVSTHSSQVLALFEAEPDVYGLLITDQTMPELSGVELAKALHSQQPNLPVILTTGYSDVINKDQAEELGFEFLSKPFSGDELLAKVGEACKKHAQEVKLRRSQAF